MNMIEKLKNAIKNEKTRSEIIGLVMLLIFIVGSFYVGRASVAENWQEQLQQEREQLKQLQSATQPKPLPPITKDSEP